MSKRKKQVVWHKKRGKFIPSSMLKVHEQKQKSSDPAAEPIDAVNNPRQQFAKKLSSMIKQAVRSSHGL